MSLLSRLTIPLAGETKIATHQFMAALAEYKRAAPGVTLAAIASAFGVAAGQETTDLGTLASFFVSDVITREQIHDVLLLGEGGIYDLATCNSRILTSGPADLTIVLMQARIDAGRLAMNDFNLGGCAVTPQASPNMTLAVAKGAIWSAGVLHPVTAGNVTIAAADAALSRLDLVVADTNGAKAVRQGTAAQKPVIGGFQGGDIPLALVYVPPGTTSIDASKMLDVRVIRTRGPLTIGQILAPVVKNNTLAQQIFVDLTCPSGLLVGGRAVRVRCGGTMLLNSGTPTVRLQIAYGGTIMFDDLSTAAVASATRIAWALDFHIVEQAASSQALNGVLEMGPLAAARTAPTAGVGDIATPVSIAASPVSAPLNGTSAINSDAADQHIQVAWTMSVANAANEVRMDYASAEVL